MLNSQALLITNDMGVDSQRDPRVGVRQLPLHDGRSRSVCQQGTGRTMPHRMESTTRDAQRIQKGMQLYLSQFVR